MKRKLSLDALEVESVPTATESPEEGRGTVHANDGTGGGVTCGLTCITCYRTCGDSCAFTCGDTCYVSCNNVTCGIGCQ